MKWIVTLWAALIGVAALGQNTVRQVPNVASLIQSAGSANSPLVETAGYYTPGDGGGAVYRWTNSLPAGVTNNATFWIAGTSGYWSFMHGGQVNIRQTGFTGSGTLGDTALLQNALDVAPSGTSFVVPSGTYDIARAILLRRHNIELAGVGTLRAPHDLDRGVMVNIANSTNVTVRGITLDANYFPINCFGVIGNFSGGGVLDAIVGTNWVSGVVISGVRAVNARYHANMIEALDLDSPPAFTPGNELWQLSNGKRQRATILTNDVANSRVTVLYLDSRFSIGPEVEEFASGASTGQVRTVVDRTNVPQPAPFPWVYPEPAPNGFVYSSTQGRFGGKGISVQYGTRGVTVSDFHIEDCDVGISIEGNSASGRANTGTVVLGGVIRNAGRTPFWFTNSGPFTDSPEAFSPIIIGTRIVNWGHTWSGFGAFSSDRGAFMHISGVNISMDESYQPAGPVVLWQGQSTHSSVEFTADVPEAAWLLDFRRHGIWGNLSGNLVDGSRNNVFRVRANLDAVSVMPAWTNSLATNVVSPYAVTWDPSAQNALSLSTVYLDARGWTNGFDSWFGEKNSTVVYEITDRSDNSKIAIGSSDNVEFGSSGRMTLVGLGTKPQRNAAKFYDEIDVYGKISIYDGNAIFAWDFTNSVPYLRATTGTFRLRNTSDEDVALLSSGRFTLPSAAYDGKNLAMGNQVLWFRGSTMYTKAGTPSSSSDGQPVVPSPTTSGLTTSVGAITVTGGNKTTYSHRWIADGDVNLVFLGLVDGDTGTIQVSPATTNVVITLSDSFAFSPTGSTLTVNGGTGSTNFTVIAWENKVVNSTNRVAVNASNYYR